MSKKSKPPALPDRRSPEKPLVVISANTAWNLYSRRNLIRAIQAAGFEVICAGVVGSVTGTKTAAKAQSSVAESGAEAATGDKYSELIEGELGASFIPIKMAGDSTNPFKDLALFFFFFRLYKRLKPAVVLHFNNKSDIYGTLAASLCGIPSISNVTGLGAAAEKTGLTGRLIFLLYKCAFMSKGAFVFFQNKDDKAFFIEGKICREERTGLLPGSGVDTEFFAPASVAANNGGEGRSREEGECRFLFIGRLLVSKGACDFIEAAKIVRAEHPLASFEMLGELDPLNPIFIEKGILEQAVASGVVAWRGASEDVRPFIAASDCVVLPSYFREGCPRVLLEAASMAKPLIAADSPGTREPVEDSVNGFLCAPANPESLASKMEAFLLLSKEERLKMGAASRKIAVTRFSDKIVADAYVKAIEAVAS